MIAQFRDCSGDVFTCEGGSWYRHDYDPDFGRRFPVSISRVCIGSVHPFADGLDLDQLIKDGEMDVGSKVMLGFEPSLKAGFIPVFVDGERVFYGSPIVAVDRKMRY